MAATDNFADYTKGLDSPYDVAEVVTPHNSNDLAAVSRALYVGVAGDVTCVVGGTAVLFKAMPVGLHRIRTSRVNSTGTTATNMVALS